MTVYRMYRRQALRLSLSEAWDFLSSPHHLNEITPAFFNVEITSEVPDRIYAGLLISYKMKAVFGIPMTWLSEVCHCDEPNYFIYQQRIGPFKFWSHEVRLTEYRDGILVEDIMFYAMPFGWLGSWINNVMIADRLDRIFAVRRDALQAKWGMCE